MKIEIDVDDGSIRQQIINTLDYKISNEILKIAQDQIKTLIDSCVKNELREKVNEILATITFSDGVTFENYIVNTLTRPNRYDGKMSMRSIVDRVVQEKSEEIVKDLARNDLKTIGEEIKRSIGLQIASYLKL